MALEPEFACRPGCAACCIAPSISSPIPGMPQGKPAGQVCIQLDQHGLCRLYGEAARPAVCEHFLATSDVCGETASQALQLLARLEFLTRVD